jgi:cytochrome P450
LTRTGQGKSGEVWNGFEKQTRLRKELLDPDNDGWQHDYSKLKNLPYLDAVIKEVLRLYAPIRYTRRTAEQDDVIPLGKLIRLLDGSTTKSVCISKGDDVFIFIWQMNTDTGVWGDGAMTFRPERWLQEGQEYYDGGLTLQALQNPGLDHLATFTVGPRSCVGRHFAIAVIKILLALIVSHYELRPIELPGEEPVEIDWKNVALTRPFRKDTPDKFDMPCRLHRLSAHT